MAVLIKRREQTMGRKKRNSSLVQELINGRWTMNQVEFENKYNSLSLDDMCKVADAIDNMQNEYMDSDVARNCARLGPDELYLLHVD